MYYPKNQIQTGFYSNGELIEARSKQLYTGPYFKTSDGLFYSGKEPNEGKNIVLLLSGGNNDISRYNEIMQLNLEHLGLRHYFIVQFNQKPGELQLFINNAIRSKFKVLRRE